MHAPLKLRETSDESGGCTLAIGGELDIATASQFRRTIGTLMGTGCRELIVDLAGTRFIDSSGLGALVWAAHRMHAAGGRLAVVNPDDRIAKVLAITGVEELLLVDGPRA